MKSYNWPLQRAGKCTTCTKAIVYGKTTYKHRYHIFCSLKCVKNRPAHAN